MVIKAMRTLEAIGSFTWETGPGEEQKAFRRLGVSLYGSYVDIQRSLFIRLIDAPALGAVLCRLMMAVRPTDVHQLISIK